MAVYAIGDVQGCFLTLEKLLNVINFNEKNDEIIFLGDVVNRGPRSLEVLNLIMSHSESMKMVLGNHEIFAIALSLGAIEPNRPHTLQALLKAPDRDAIMFFLRKQPFIIKRNHAVFVHAGILPCHSVDVALEYAGRLSLILTSDEASGFLERFYVKIPESYKDTQSEIHKLRLVLAYLTLLRMCSSETTMDLSYKGAVDKAPKRLKPWFELRKITTCPFILDIGRP